MNDHDLQSNASDAQLESYFQRLRRAEQASAPNIPSSATTNVVALAPSARNIYRSLSQMAAAIAVLAVGIGLFVQQPSEDPAALYSDIMSGQSMQTDALMQVSSSVLPAVYDLPQLYDTGFTYDTDALINL
ncbi:MAG: hypothetical protein ACI9NT_000284 [Bacteroidia bacterium]|jgi:hypothetical protein